MTQEKGSEAVLDSVVLTRGMRLPCELLKRAGQCVDLA